jgi:hypothetical protein
MGHCVTDILPGLFHETGRERKLIGLHGDDADLKHLFKLIAELEENPPKGDISFMQVRNGFRRLGVLHNSYCKRTV